MKKELDKKPDQTRKQWKQLCNKYINERKPCEQYEIKLQFALIVIANELTRKIFTIY